LRAAETVAVPAAYAELVLTPKDTEAAPDDTDTVLGAVMDPAVEIATVAPVVAAADKVMVQTACPPWLRDVGLKLKPVTASGGASKVIWVD
jgi:hypothetical protein